MVMVAATKRIHLAVVPHGVNLIAVIVTLATMKKKLHKTISGT